MKKILVMIAAALLVAQGAFALQELAGQVVINTPIGGSSTSTWGLLNEGDETITASLSADGEAAKYLSFPSKVTLIPGNILYVNVTASLPSSFDRTGNITGSLYALQEGATGGQMKINVQVAKSVVIIAYGKISNANSPNNVQVPSEMEQSSNSEQVISDIQTISSPTGFFALISGHLVEAALVVVIAVMAVMLVRARKK